MTVSKTMLDKQLERAMARNAAKKAPQLKPEPAKAKLSKEEIQHYVDILVEASEPDPTTKLERLMNDSADLTHQILLKRFPQAGN